METKLININQKKAMVALSKELMCSDGYIEPQEELFLQNLCGELGVERSSIPNNIDYENLAKTFDNDEIRCEVLNKLVALANIDGNYDLYEKDFIKHVANYLSINTETLEKIESEYLK